ncbi:hypothetical protein HU200_003902 [Digitaria exilis]|uniref:Bifunctional inhibitor/plant lipid transfer protein/seed storage helical domain-containing protein n=1 Tax=Digitaria exilis TaxID=1010633 RepID=A0A835KTZ0_9POAL|nr:hypothetical protein HU200_031459 [Digitaria exilis]KAF8776080.1 hypothetical protein HU200_003902 [Digitaria exilis]
MMAMKVILKLLALYLVFTMFMTHHAWGEEDCYKDKVLVALKCRKTIEIGIPYTDPSDKCRSAVEKSNMACICHNHQTGGAFHKHE